MSTIVDRYDRDAADYARYWAPVLEPTAVRLLESVADALRRLGDRAVILDVGAGTGALALAAARRWPQAHVIAAEPASGMLDIARRRATDAGLARPERLSFVVGGAEQLPLDDAAVDVAVSSFVLQLVSDRPATLREMRRVLRPGGMAAYVTWLDRDARQPFRPMEEFDEVVMDLNVEEPEWPDEAHAGDVPSARAAANEMRRAGFRQVAALEDELVHDWTADSYLEYKLAYDERTLVALLGPEQRRRLENEARRRLQRLPPAEFRWRPPIVFVTGVRPP